MAARTALVVVSRAGAPALRRGPQSALRRFGSSGGAMMPPFKRTPTPTSPLHEEHELIWDDGVAAETCIDFEIPHTSSKEILAWFFGGIAFVTFIYEMINLSDPEGSRMAAIKGTDGAELPFNNAAVARGGDPSAASSGDDADDDEDE